MKPLPTLLSLFLLIPALVFGQWKPAGDNLKSTWGENLDPEKVWLEYPRPIMARDQWQNLNGLWDYAVVNKGHAEPTTFDGKILVPFCLESSLSGVQKPLNEKQELWYSRTFTVPAEWGSKKILLNFGGVNWQAEVFINGVSAGTHSGDNAGFSLDITSLLKGAGEQHLTVRVWNPANTMDIPVGKQHQHPSLIWYTAVSGIWQTVWLEPVAEQSIQSVMAVPDIDQNTLTVKAKTNADATDTLEVILKDGANVVADKKGPAGTDLVLSVPSPKLWGPKNPFLYDLDVILTNATGEIDHVKSYAAMRKISTAKDKDGFYRIQLNNKDIFPIGPLDQGWWPDGLYTAPSEEALRYDLVKTKEWGFNMVRKHMKTEPAIWYTACDRLGLMVWQDMPADNSYPKWEPFKLNGGEEFKRSEESQAIYRKEWKEILDALMPYPCIVTWTPFNESWGQFKTVEIANWTKSYDPSRLVDPASGGNHRDCGDMVDIHHYPEPELSVFDPTRVNIVGEFGGILLTLDDHLWKADPKTYWDSKKNKDSATITKLYVEYMNQLKSLIPKGLSGGVITQTTDVEVEVNGLMTYDRKLVKMDEDAVKKATTEISDYYP